MISVRKIQLHQSEEFPKNYSGDPKEQAFSLFKIRIFH